MNELRLGIPIPPKEKDPKKKAKKKEPQRGCTVVDHTIETVSADDSIWLMWGDK